jgi:hypothetical protein
MYDTLLYGFEHWVILMLFVEDHNKFVATSSVDKALEISRSYIEALKKHPIIYAYGLIGTISRGT